jgi:hypothetical protein
MKYSEILTFLRQRTLDTQASLHIIDELNDSNLEQVDITVTMVNNATRDLDLIILTAEELKVAANNFKDVAIKRRDIVKATAWTRKEEK